MCQTSVTHLQTDCRWCIFWCLCSSGHARILEACLTLWLLCMSQLQWTANVHSNHGKETVDVYDLNWYLFAEVKEVLVCEIGVVSSKKPLKTKPFFPLPSISFKRLRLEIWCIFEHFYWAFQNSCMCCFFILTLFFFQWVFVGLCVQRNFTCWLSLKVCWGRLLLWHVWGTVTFPQKIIKN